MQYIQHITQLRAAGSIFYTHTLNMDLAVGNAVISYVLSCCAQSNYACGPKPHGSTSL